MRSQQSIPRYNHRTPNMRARTSSGLRPGFLILLPLTILLLQSAASASNFGDAARQMAHKIAAESGPGAFSLEVTNRSSLDEKSAREVRSALEAELHLQGVEASKAEQAMGTIAIILSESLREYVWTAEIVVGSDEKKIVFVSLPRPPTGTPFAAAPSITLKKTFLFTQEQPMLDVALIEIPGGSRLLVLGSNSVSIYRQQGSNLSGRWNLETSLPLVHSRAFPRDLRGLLLLRRDHLFDVYLPGVFCRSSSNSAGPLTLACNESDDPWPLTLEDGNGNYAVRAFYAASRNFFTGALSPGIGKVSNVPSFYAAAALARPNYTLWAFTAVDGSLHLVDGMTDQLIRGANWGSDLAAIRSGCGAGTQLLSSGSGEGNPAHDFLRAFEVPDRDPVAVSSPLEFNGQIAALWPESNAAGASAIVKSKDTGWYEAYRISISCTN